MDPITKSNELFEIAYTCFNQATKFEYCKQASAVYEPINSLK